MRYWKRAIEITVELGCRVMNSEFNGRPEPARRSEGQFWRSMEELLPVFEREGVQLAARAAPGRLHRGRQAAVDMIRGINSPLVTFLYCAPHTFHLGGDLRRDHGVRRRLLTHLHIADTFDHRASSGLRYIVNPPGSTARVHQHLDIGQGEVDWDEFFATLGEMDLRRTTSRPSASSRGRSVRASQRCSTARKSSVVPRTGFPTDSHTSCQNATRL